MSDLGEFQLIERCFKRPARRQPLGWATTVPAAANGRAITWPSPPTCWSRAVISLPTSRPGRWDQGPWRSTSQTWLLAGPPVAFQLALSPPLLGRRRLAVRAVPGHARLGGMPGHAELLGGDTTAGTLNLCITVLGEVPQGQALLRSGARPGDQVWVSGVLGDARDGPGWSDRPSRPGRCHPSHAGRQALEWWQPRIALGLAPRGVATAAMDLSDGLAGDLPHLLRASCVGADIRADGFPVRPPGTAA